MSSVSKSKLRWPWERPIVLLAFLINLALIAFAILIVVESAELVRRRPDMAADVAKVRSLAMLAILALPALALAGFARRGRLRGDAVRVSRDQLPSLHDLLRKQCERLGIGRIPELYVSNLADESHSRAILKRQYILLSTKEVSTLSNNLDVAAFYLGRQIGAIHLGHARWWLEVLLFYVLKVPFVGAMVRRAWATSQDRCGAFLAPDPARALLVLSVGTSISQQVDGPTYLRQTLDYRGFWDRIGSWTAKSPPIAKRLKALHNAGFLG